MLRFDLARLIRRALPRFARQGRVIKLAEITPTAVLAANLERLYLRPVRRWWEGSRDQLLVAYRRALQQSAVPGFMMDDNTGAAVTLSSVMRQLSEEIERLVLDLTYDMTDWVVQVEVWHRLRWGAAMQPHGVNLKTLIGAEDVADTLEVIMRENVSLVRNVSDSLKRRIEHVVYEGFTSRTPAREIAKELSEATGIERKRAVRIAANQTNKLSSQLDTERMRQAGITQWEWRHSGKVHFRPVHKARNGKIYTFENAPEDMPGMLPYCGCKKRAVLTFD